MHRSLIVLSLTLAAVSTADAQRASRDTASLRRTMQDRAVEFVRQWRKEFTSSVTAERGGPPTYRPQTPPGSPRLANAHCHFDGSFQFDSETGIGRPFVAQPNVIRATNNSRFSVCPDWYLDNYPPLRANEAVNPDDALGLDRVSSIRAARSRLIASLDTAWRQHPENVWFTGQLIRFRLDAQDVDGAWTVAANCRAGAVHCANLAGLVLHRRGDIRGADSAFRVALSRMNEKERCDWNSLRLIIPADARGSFDRMSCADREVAVTRFWWLADPLYTESGNERRVEHYARKVRVALHTALPVDYLYNYGKREGGDAVEQMLLRYGWPSTSWWGGHPVDEGHSNWLQMDAMEPYTAPEYSMGRPSTAPSWEAVLDPLSASNDDFALSAPPGTDSSMWWPIEHYYRAAGKLALLDEGQLGYFRRDNSTVLVHAVRIAGPAFANNSGETGEALFVISPAPDTAIVVARQRTTFGQRITTVLNLDTVDALAGVEVPPRAKGSPTARARFGISVPAPISKLRTKAVSTPLVFQAVSDEIEAGDNLAWAVEQMYPTTRIEQPQRLGVYWESYGYAPGDTISVSVRMQRITNPGRWRRVGMALRLADDPNSATTVTWREPQPGRSTQVIPASVPVLGRTLVLNVSSLITGAYRLEITMQKAGDVAVSNSRIIHLTR